MGNNRSRNRQKPAVNLHTKLAELISNLRGTIAGRLGTSFDGARDLYAVLGYKRDLDFADFASMYERGDIAARIVDAPPQSTWRRKPIVSTDSNPDTFTKFEIEWSAVAQKMKVFHYMERADKLAGIGQYGVLLIGTDDVRSMEDMARPMGRLRKGINSLLYLTPFAQGSADIAELDTDPSSEHFGLPLMYKIKMASGGGLGATALMTDAMVHWSRVIHIAEGLREDDVYGTPRLKSVFNRLFDVDKIAGGSAEIFWQAAKRIMVLEAKDGFSAVDSDDALTGMMDEVIHGLRRVIDLQGYEAKVLETSDVKPDEAFRVALALISSATGIPQRILLGSEQGKMASTQDEINWNGRVADRQLNFAEQVILRPFIDRLIKVNALPPPEANYTITWPSLFELSDKEKAQIGLLKARAVKMLVGKAGEDFAASEKVVSLDEIRGDLLNLRSKKIEHSKQTSSGQGDNLPE